MTRFSANLGFLWQEHSLPDAIHAAAQAGFEAVECHWPYDTPADQVNAALEHTGLPMLGLNTRRGDVDAGDNGVAAIPGREAEARGYIDESIAYAASIACANIHVMAGYTDKSAACDSTFQENLRYACQNANAHGITILIEPLNHIDAPGYHLSTLDKALETLSKVNLPNLKIMFDCYHLQIMQGDLIRRLKTHLKDIGHIQIAAVPDRSEPDNGELHYPNIYRALDEMGWDGYIGAEYKPRAGTDAGLSWFKHYKRSPS
ncbi:MAG: hydroxypyruvate isomerase family protein [Granulosicoccus sp.]